MASSRGRAKLAEKNQKKYVFGSSTPRELTHISVPPIFRAIDSKSQKEIAERSHSAASIMATSILMMNKPKINLAYYVRKAHHSQPPSRNPEIRNTKSFAFGSSTPREFTHLDRILPSLRIYDAKIKRKKQLPIRSPSLNDARKGRSQSNNERNDKKDEDDIASEPDIVQYRKFDFLKRDNDDQAKNTEKRKESKTRTSMGEENVIETDIAVDLATEAQRTIAVVKQQITNSPDHQQLISVPVIEAHEDSNPVLNEDRQVFESVAQNVVKSLGNLEDVAKSLTDDSVFESTIITNEEEEDDDVLEDHDNGRTLSPILSGRSK